MLEILKFFKNLNSFSKWCSLFIIYNTPGLSGRKISVISGMGWAPIKKSLDELCQHKLVVRQKDGRSYSYFPNNHHILYPFLKDLFEEMEHIHEVLFKDLSLTVFENTPEELLSLKLSSENIYLITLSEEVYRLERAIRNYLEKKGLGDLKLNLVPFRALKIPEKYKEIARISGRTCGVSFSKLLKRGF